MATKSKAVKKVVVEMERERSTKNKQRFKIDDDDNLDVIYVKNKGDKKLGEPDQIRVTIEAL